ncbi:MAG: HTH domain-containing protein [Verrucomicrobiales bacterium]|nr:HTH domain-containing protein [Verrucomicrobiales bacterium]
MTFAQLGIYYQEQGLELSPQFLDNLDMRLASGEYNFAAYLLADHNGASIKVVKYAGEDKINLIENEEFGYRCLITATNRVLDKLAVENRTFARITYPKRIEQAMVDKAALREAVINAIVHNDYNKAVPLVEIFSNRMVITSAGGLVDGLSVENFFSGRSMPRNRELMRVFKDVELVEHIGSGMSRIMRAYDRSIFEFTPSFFVVTLPFAKDKTSDTENGTELGTDGAKDEKIILSLIQGNEKITFEQLALKTNLSRRTISRIVKLLQSKGSLARIGSVRSGFWKVLK